MIFKTDIFVEKVETVRDVSRQDDFFVMTTVRYRLFIEVSDYGHYANRVEMPPVGARWKKEAA